MTSVARFDVVGESFKCFLLELDNYRFLLDCGWTSRFDVNDLERLKAVAPTVQAVLLTYPDINHLGALPYAMSKLGLSCPIYATTPVQMMGQFFLYDAYEARRRQEEFDTFTLDDVDHAFDNITSIKYSQTVNLPGVGISITAYPAGHMIGGSVWRISKDGENVVYAVDYNHRREWHLNSCALEVVTWPSVLITDTLNASYVSPKRREVLGNLLGAVRTSLDKQGNVLILADTAGRAFELLQVLNQLASKIGNRSACQFFFLGACAQVVIDTVKTLVDFLSDGLQAQINEHKASPFNFENIKLAQSLQTIWEHQGPKVVVTADLGLEAGFARQLLAEWAAHEANSVIFTARPDTGTLADSIYSETAPETLQLRVGERVELEGEELEQHRQQQQEKEQQERVASKEALHMEEEEFESDEEEQGPSAPRHDLMAVGTTHRRRHNAVFPSAPDYDLMEWDDYGLKVDMSRYRIEVTNEPAPEEDMGMDDRDDSADILTALLDTPTKIVSKDLEVPLRCKVHRFDIEGRTDGESMRRILEHVKPRNLVLVHGKPEPTDEFAGFCRSKLGVENIVMPSYGRAVEITSGRNIFQVTLREALVSSLELRRAGDYEVAWVDGLMAKGMAMDTSGSEESSPAYQEEGTQDGEATQEQEQQQQHAVDMDAGVPELDVDDQPEPHDVVFVGDLRLSDFKRLLIDTGYEAYFSHGMLVVNDTVAIVKSASGINVEGPLCQDYLAIRDLLYNQFAIA